MKAWQYLADGKPLTLNEVDEPTAGPGDVLIDVRATGICHTDIGFLDGTISSQLTFSPITLGHEIAGVVVGVGADVHGLNEGDRVAVLARPEGPGTARNGGFQRLVAAQAELVVPLPDGVSWDQAAVSTDAGATSYHAIVVRGRLQPGERMCVIGMGGLGSLGVQMAVGMDAEVYVVDSNPDVFDYARELGVRDVARDVSELRDLDLDLICDFAGTGTTTAGAIETVRRAGRVVLVGLGSRHGTINLFAVTLRELELLGSLGGTTEDNAKVLALMSAGRLSARTAPVGFADVGDAVSQLARGQVTGRLVVVYD